MTLRLRTPIKVCVRHVPFVYDIHMTVECVCVYVTRALVGEGSYKEHPGIAILYLTPAICVPDFSEAS